MLRLRIAPRALEFTVIFIKGLCEEYKKRITTDRLDHLATDAYNRTLKHYHSWLVQNIFKVSHEIAVLMTMF